MARALVAVCFWCAAGCASVEWREPPAELPRTWRHLRLYDGPAAFVLASSEAAAAEAHEEVAAAAEAFAAELGEPPRRGLIVALSADDPLLFDGLEQFAWLAERWRAEIVRQPPPQQASPRADSDVAPEDQELAVRLLGVGMPTTDTTLGLPAELRERAAFVQLQPTLSCLDTISERIVERAFAREDVGWLESAPVTTLVGSPAALLRDEVARENRKSLFENWLYALDVSPAVALRICKRGGVLPPDAELRAVRVPADAPRRAR
jgi:hypothetical protein